MHAPVVKWCWVRTLCINILLIISWLGIMILHTRIKIGVIVDWIIDQLSKGKHTDNKVPA